MSYVVTYEPEALADLEKLSQDIRQRIVNKIDWLGANFEHIPPQPLSSNLAGFFKLRVGDYRVIYEFSSIDLVIIINRVGLRREIYELM